MSIANWVRNLDRPNIVWFGEDVPMIEAAIPLMLEADIVIVIGTSLQVYPAAGQLDFSKPATQIYNIDLNSVMKPNQQNLTIINQKAGIAVPKLVRDLTIPKSRYRKHKDST